MLYLPLKGIIMKDYYPSVGMRQMSDNDILFDADAWERMEKHMISEGYKAEYVGKGNHDVYHKLRLQALQRQWYRLAYLNGFYAYLNAKGDTFNLDYIRTECKNIGIICFVGCGESGGTEIQCRVVGHKSY